MRKVAIALAGLLAACGSDDDERAASVPDEPEQPAAGGSSSMEPDVTEPADDRTLIDGFSPPLPGEGETQILTPIIDDIEPGENVNICTYLPDKTERDMVIVKATGYQSTPLGHHTILYATNNEREPGSHVCDGEDMTNSIFLATGSTPVEGREAHIPEGVGFFIPAGTQFFVQSHWINTGTEPAAGQGAFNVTMVEPTDGVEPASLLSVSALGIDVPPGESATTTTTCEFDTDREFFVFGGHAHEWATNVKITYEAAGQPPEVVYDEPWEEEFASDSPQMNYEKESPFLVRAGDKLHVECQYQNTRDTALGFPDEMCLMFGYYFPGTDQVVCVEGAWISTAVAP